MIDIYGVNAQQYYGLPAEQQADVRQAFDATTDADATTPGTDVSSEGLAPRDPALASTPEEAVDAIHSLPLPDYGGLGALPYRMPLGEATAMQLPYKQHFNAVRAQLAQDALDRMAPDRGDYLPQGQGHVGELEYRDASSGFNNDPYVKELTRIVDEAISRPDVIPSYLYGGSTPATSGYSDTQVRSVLSTLGIEISPDAPPELLQDGIALLDTLPADLVAVLVNPGMEVSYEVAPVGITTPGRVSGGHSLTIEGTAELSEVQVGANFAETQQFRLSIDTGERREVGYGPNTLDRLRKWANRIDTVGNDRLADLTRNSPVLDGLRNNGSKLLPITGNYAETTGTRVEYETQLTPEAGARLADGDLSAAPNPLDPINMAPGTSVLIRSQQFEATEWHANFKLARIGNSSVDLSGFGMGVRRAEGSIVEVYSGDIDTMESVGFAGIGKGSYQVGVGVGERTDQDQMQIARIDLATSEGRAAYQQFMSNGQVPDWSPPGVQQSGTVSAFSREDTLAFTAQLGALGGSVVSENLSSSVETRWQDGSGELVMSSGSPGGNFTQTTVPINVDGTYADAAGTHRFVMSNISDGDASFFHEAYATGQASTGSDKQHVQLTFNDAELMELRDLARTYVDLREEGRELTNSYQELKDGEYPDDRLEAIALAEEPYEVLNIITNTPTQGWGFYGIGVELLGMARLLGTMDRAESLPGSLQFVES